MELLDNLKTDWKTYNKRALECQKVCPNCADDFKLLKEGENLFTRWADVIGPEDEHLFYTKETATDFRGVYLDTELNLDWCNEYEVDSEREYARDFTNPKDPWDRISTYGVADNIAQIHAFVQEQEAQGYDFGKCIINIRPILRKHEPAQGGWRWHKWGRYIGNFDHCCEYIHDEEGIEMVLCFRIIPLKKREISLEDELVYSGLLPESR